MGESQASVAVRIAWYWQSLGYKMLLGRMYEV